MSNHGTEKGERTHASFIEFPISHKGGGGGVEEDINFHEPQNCYVDEKAVPEMKTAGTVSEESQIHAKKLGFWSLFSHM